MSIQVFLQGRLRGIEEFLLAPAHASESGTAGPCGEALLIGRTHWVTLLGEVLPRALLAELGLAPMLLGFSGGGRFLVVLPEEARARAEEFLDLAQADIAALSGDHLRLTWAITENLGEWSIVRRRLAEVFRQNRNSAWSARMPEALNAFPSAMPDTGDYFPRQMGVDLREARAVGWSPQTPGRILLSGGKHTWPLGAYADSLPVLHHAALDDDSNGAADLPTLARRADGTPAWGVLRGDVDDFAIRLRRLDSIEENVQLSVFYKHFFAGELEVVCSMPEFWRKVTVLHTGGDNFAVCGAWDALLPLAREIERLFRQFAGEKLGELPGAEGKTISMAAVIAQDVDTPLAAVYREAGRRLEIAKSTGKDCIDVFGRTVEWKQLARAAELKENMLRLIREFGCSRQFLGELGGFYRDRAAAGESTRFDRPWRYHRRFNRVVGRVSDREFQKLRFSLITELIGRNPTQVNLRPAGRVAVAWARQLTGNEV